MKHEEPHSPVSFVANVARLPHKGLPVVIIADEAQRTELAREHDLLSVENYRAEILVAPWKRNGLKITGRVEADITQACIVTLEPVQAHVDEAVEALFLPEDSKFGREGFDSAGEIMLDADGPDSPETFSGDKIDVGALAEQFFGLAIDPYPRKQGVSLQAGTDNEPAENEFQQKLRSLLGKS
ncbi:DUF177 domain-containing protein [Mesorhizobium sp. INR15]|uniref:YceD family protein n=1 Tax=Mesorhizobium sp. INR15 TaxID=2654248 RepID=UPI0018964B96|nr:DUF177 domain-containing protein [Mesorhizobium sp. INR15]QPC93555.1 DUF177 domain-containing protein [Mesorhizobium sp. INR15]